MKPWIGTAALAAMAILSRAQELPGFDALLDTAGDTPFVVSVAPHPFRAELRYRPGWALEADALRQLAATGALRTGAVAELLSATASQATFVLVVGPHPKLSGRQRVAGDIVRFQPDRATYSANIKRLTYGMDGKFSIQLRDGTRIPAGFYHLERSWGIGHTNRFLVTFPVAIRDRNLAEESGFEVVFEDLDPRLGRLVFRYEINPMAAAEISPERLTALLAPKSQP